VLHFFRSYRTNRLFSHSWTRFYSFPFSVYIFVSTEKVISHYETNDFPSESINVFAEAEKSVLSFPPQTTETGANVRKLICLIW